MKLALVIAAIDPSVGGVLVFGDRGTGKSTTVRAGRLLPPMRVIAGCAYGCDPPPRPNAAARCRARGPRRRGAEDPPGAGAGGRPAARRHRNRVVGALDLERCARPRRQAFRPGLLGPRIAASYIDEVNLLGTAWSTCAGRGGPRARTSWARGPQRAASARFVLIGSGNPGGGRVAAAAARPLRALGRGAHADRSRDPGAGGTPSRRLRARPAAFVASGRHDATPRRRIVKAREQGRGHHRCHAGARRATLPAARHRRLARRADLVRAARRLLEGRRRGDRCAPENVGTGGAAPPAAPQTRSRSGLLGARRASCALEARSARARRPARRTWRRSSAPGRSPAGSRRPRRNPCRR